MHTFSRSPLSISLISTTGNNSKRCWAQRRSRSRSVAWISYWGEPSTLGKQRETQSIKLAHTRGLGLPRSSAVDRSCSGNAIIDSTTIGSQACRVHLHYPQSSSTLTFNVQRVARFLDPKPRSTIITIQFDVPSRPESPPIGDLLPLFETDTHSRTYIPRPATSDIAMNRH